MRYFTVKTSLSTDVGGLVQHCIYKMGEIVVDSRAVARLKFLRFDNFEARNRPHLHILIVACNAKNNTSLDEFRTNKTKKRGINET